MSKKNRRPKIVLPDYTQLWCNYRGLSKLEDIRQEAISLFRETLLSELDQAAVKNKLGRDSSCHYIDALKPHYFIELLSIFRQDLDNYMMECNCLNDEVFQAFKDKYQIDCVLEKAFCLPNGDLYKKAYQLFLPIHGYCDDDTTYEWDGVECLCTLEIYEIRNLISTDRTYNSVSLQWEGDYPTVFLLEAYLDISQPPLFQATTTNFNYTFEDLNPNGLYTFRIRAINCAGESLAEIMVQTLPVYLTVNTTGLGGTTFQAPNPRMVLSETDEFIFTATAAASQPLSINYIDSITISTSENTTPTLYPYTELSNLYLYPTSVQIEITGIEVDTTITINFANLDINLIPTCDKDVNNENTGDFTVLEVQTQLNVNNQIYNNSFAIPNGATEFDISSASQSLSQPPYKTPPITPAFAQNFLPLLSGTDFDLCPPPTPPRILLFTYDGASTTSDFSHIDTGLTNITAPTDNGFSFAGITTLTLADIGTDFIVQIKLLPAYFFTTTAPNLGIVLNGVPIYPTVTQIIQDNYIEFTIPNLQNIDYEIEIYTNELSKYLGSAHLISTTQKVVLPIRLGWETGGIIERISNLNPNLLSFKIGTVSNTQVNDPYWASQSSISTSDLALTPLLPNSTLYIETSETNFLDGVILFSFYNKIGYSSCANENIINVPVHQQTAVSDLLIDFGGRIAFNQTDGGSNKFMARRQPLDLNPSNIVDFPNAPIELNSNVINCSNDPLQNSTTLIHLHRNNTTALPANFTLSDIKHTNTINKIDTITGPTSQQYFPFNINVNAFKQNIIGGGTYLQYSGAAGSSLHNYLAFNNLPDNSYITQYYLGYLPGFASNISFIPWKTFINFFSGTNVFGATWVLVSGGSLRLLVNYNLNQVLSPAISMPYSITGNVYSLIWQVRQTTSAPGVPMNLRYDQARIWINGKLFDLSGAFTGSTSTTIPNFTTYAIRVNKSWATTGGTSFYYGGIEVGNSPNIDSEKVRNFNLGNIPIGYCPYEWFGGNQSGGQVIGSGSVGVDNLPFNIIGTINPIQQLW